MAEFEEKLNSILSNPALMNQIISMAGSMGQNQPSPAPQQAAQSQGMPFDPAAMQGMMQLLKSTQIDQKQMNLVRALECYLPPDRIQKLVKAMQAAKIAKYAAGALSQSR